MQVYRIAFWLLLGVLAALWLTSNALTLSGAGLMVLRDPAIQLTGVLCIGSMSAAVILALRARWSERLLDGLDKSYRLHRSLGISALIFAILHWIITQLPKWLNGLGLLEPRHHRGVGAPPLGNGLEQLLLSQRRLAETVGEWSFYAAALLIAIALTTRVPYRIFYHTHRLIALVFLALVFHAVLLFQYQQWITPIGVVLGVMLASATIGAIISLIGRIGSGKRVEGRLTAFHFYPELQVIEGEVEVTGRWPGHKPGQFAFVKTSRWEGHHPFSIASAWDPAVRKLTFIVKALGDFTSTLKDRARVGGEVTIEGPYGAFTFDDDRPVQIWIAGGIGITPFLARLNWQSRCKDRRVIHLFHTTADYSQEAIAKLNADAAAAGVHLHVLQDERDGLLTADRIREVVGGWRKASIWFCGPARFGEAIKRDFAAHGLEVRHYHQELFSWR